MIGDQRNAEQCAAGVKKYINEEGRETERERRKNASPRIRCPTKNKFSIPFGARTGNRKADSRSGD